MTNCLFFALALYWRRRGRAGQRYIMTRWSRLGWTPHFLYAELRRGRIRIISFKPNNTAFKAVPPPVFAGRAAWGDAPPESHNGNLSPGTARPEAGRER